jgi:hypothetical protein
MNNLLEKYGCLILSAKQFYQPTSSNTFSFNDIFILEIKNNNTFRLIRGDNYSIYYESYGECIIVDNPDRNTLILDFTYLEQDFHVNNKINIKQTIEYKIKEEEIIINTENTRYKSNYTIIFNKQPTPLLNSEINIEKTFYCNLEEIL